MTEIRVREGGEDCGTHNEDTLRWSYEGMKLTILRLFGVFLSGRQT